MCVTGCVCARMLACMWFFAYFCSGRNVWKERFGIFRRSNHNFLIFRFTLWYDTLEWISPFDWFLAFLCYQAADLSVNLWLTLAVKMMFDNLLPFLSLFSMHLFLPSLLHLFMSSSATELCHCLPEQDEAGGRGLVGGVFEWFGMQRQHRSVSLQEPSPYLLNGLWAREQKQREAEWEWLDSLQRAGRKRTAAR